MEVAESTKVVLSRIQELEPENATKIIGYLLLEHNQQEVIEYAYGPDNLIHSLINEAKAYLSASQKPINSASLQPLPNHLLSNMSLPTISPPFSPITSHRVSAPYYDPHLISDQQSAAPKLDLPPHQCNEFAGGLRNQAEFLSGEGQLQFLNYLGPDISSNYCFLEAANGSGLGLRNGMRSHPGVTDFPSRTCHYFHRGFCKHGINCRYGHAQDFPDSLSPLYNLNMNQMGNDDPIFAPGSLEKLEMEIVEILRARGGHPLSIAALPLVYQEMYGRSLQAEGYLTESQRHGKTGYSLTKLLARLKHSIRLIDRAHGQHDLVLAEDAPKYMEYRNGRSDSGAEPGSSHQIYLTFPAESTFTEEEVAEYFKQYGPVCDVRIPRQEKRMFGFVSFMYPETVKLILSKGHPHYICGARVLVKPYKEKSKMNDRKYSEKIELPVYYHSPFPEMDPDLNSFPRACGNPRVLEKHVIQDSAQFLELERRRLFELHLSPKPTGPHSYFTSMNDLKFSDDHFSSSPVLDKCSTDEKARNTSNSSSDQDSVHIELPDSPFASPR